MMAGGWLHRKTAHQAQSLRNSGGAAWSVHDSNKKGGGDSFGGKKSISTKKLSNSCEVLPPPTSGFIFRPKSPGCIKLSMSSFSLAGLLNYFRIKSITQIELKWLTLVFKSLALAWDNRSLSIKVVAMNG